MVGVVGVLTLRGCRFIHINTMEIDAGASALYMDYCPVKLVELIALAIGKVLDYPY